MFKDNFTHEVGDFLRQQATDMMNKQLSVSKAVYNERTGTLNRMLSSKVFNVQGMSIDVSFPLHIRFLDMKRASIKKQITTKTVIRNHSKVTKKVLQGKKKTTYAPIYNKYVYGYLKSAVWKKLKRAIPAYMIQEFRETIDRDFRPNFK